ncbi:hypothetical protein C8R44DRAFT_819188 [Mycena epipterygia]|nr:hypothetical protein C8R44DRAFT_819188 [Mycena epipterygia]
MLQLHSESSNKLAAEQNRYAEFMLHSGSFHSNEWTGQDRLLHGDVIIYTATGQPHKKIEVFPSMLAYVVRVVHNPRIPTRFQRGRYARLSF